MATSDTRLGHKQCRTGVHTDHLCYILSQGFHLSDEQEYKALVDNPEYRCNHCGRTARNEANLCVPAHL